MSKNNDMDKIRLEILRGNHMEHFKIAKEMASYLEVDNPRKKRIEDEANNIIGEIHKIKK
jgi:hypothetical protein